MTEGINNAFQDSKKDNNKAVTKTGFIHGMYIFLYILNSDKPSILAIFNSSIGKSFEFCLNKYILNDTDIDPIIRAIYVSIKFKELKIKNIGIISIKDGINIGKNENKYSFFIFLFFSHII